MNKDKNPANDEFQDAYIGSVHSDTIQRLFSEEDPCKKEESKKLKRFLHRKK